MSLNKINNLPLMALKEAERLLQTKALVN